MARPSAITRFWRSSAREAWEKSIGLRTPPSQKRSQALQVYDAQSLDLVAEVPAGRRCWHFTFTPDNSRILRVCGRSDNLYVIDASSYEILEVLEGFDLPWGVLTYPRAHGSLDLP
ncbi:hypothetical protein MYX75_10995 [Acidobacteria bacterium AH-259-A15]|nr:hypothetical protein [Acidobacteria bacterium AH-259-A15]